MRRTAPSFGCRIVLLGLLVGMCLATRIVSAQEFIERDRDLADRPIAEVRLIGVEEKDDQLVGNNLRAAVGDPYDGDTVRGDVDRLYKLGRFRFVTAEAMLLENGTVAVIYTVVTQPPIRAVQTVGNKAISDQELRAVIRQVPGGPRDPYLIEKAKRDIKTKYREKGYYLTDVSIDETELNERGLLIFNVIEGPRVKVKAIVFDGVAAFTSSQIGAEIKARTHIPILRRGVLDEDVLAEDKAAIDAFYKERGFIDVRVGHTIALSPDNKEAKVTFLVSEGRRYTLRSVQTLNRRNPDEPLTVFSPEQIAALLELKTGDVLSRDKLRRSMQIVADAYGVMGFLQVDVDSYELRSGPEPEVDLLIDIDEGEEFKVGVIRINGNFLTKDKIIRRLIRLKPGRPYDSVEAIKSERRIRDTRLFNNVRLTIQDPDLLEPSYRDLLVEVEERNTGSVNFGLAVGSDSGAFGDFSLIQSNFDVADVPESLNELVTGRAFRGAGQRFNMTLRPGNELFQYSMSLTEPHLFETDYALTVSGLFRQRQFRDYDEERIRGSVGVTRRLGDIWQVGVSTRGETVELTDIDLDAPVDVFRDQGPDTLTGFALALTRTTVDQFTRPGKGSRVELSIERVGIFGGDVEFFTTSADYTVYVTLDRDFFGRKTTLRLDSRAGYIFDVDRAPTYERFYLGGRSFRGFEFRTISPRGIRNDTGLQGDDPVGGEWLFFLGGQLEFPLMQETITGVLFVDSGTVTNELGFDDYRVSVGAGVRLYIPMLGPVPIAFDFGFPIVELEGDEEQVLSFSAELPF